MDERLRFVARLLEGDKMATLRREFEIPRPGSPCVGFALGRTCSHQSPTATFAHGCRRQRLDARGPKAPSKARLERQDRRDGVRPPKDEAALAMAVPAASRSAVLDEGVGACVTVLRGARPALPCVDDHPPLDQRKRPQPASPPDPQFPASAPPGLEPPNPNPGSPRAGHRRSRTKH